MTNPVRQQQDSVRAKYEKSVCQRLALAKPVPLREVLFADGSEPEKNRCHDNVDRWVRENSGASVMRGWVNYMPTVNGIMLTAHSVVRDADGKLFDITSLADERVRPAMRFVPHIGDEQLFHSTKESSIFIECSEVCD
jgi:hypothetical protein